MTRSDAQLLLLRDARNEAVLFPFLNGEDLNSHPSQQTERWVINFFDWPEHRARQFEDCFAIVEERVRPERALNARARRRDLWWQYGETSPGLHRALTGRARVLVITRHSKVVLPLFAQSHQVFSDALIVFAYEDDFHLGILTSAFHWWWVLTHASTLETRIRYTPTDCFETFPQPPFDAGVEAAGKALDQHRAPLMIRNNEGLTKTYNRVHNPDDHSPGIQELRDMHVALDLMVRDAYGWSDVDLDHGFWDTPQGRRFTLGPAARTEVLDRLLELNHQRYAEEVAAGLHDKKKSTSWRRGAAPGAAPML